MKVPLSRAAALAQDAVYEVPVTVPGTSSVLSKLADPVVCGRETRHQTQLHHLLAL